MDQLINAANEKHALIIERLEQAEKNIKLAQSSSVNPKVNVKKVNIDDEKTRLKQENVQFKAQIDELINYLNTLESKRRQFTGETMNYLCVRQGVTNVQVNDALKNEQEVENNKPKQEKPKQEKPKQEKPKQEKPKQEKPKQEKQGSNKKEEDKPIDVSRLDLRVGKIINVQKHPDADALYLEEIDCGEDKPRTVISGLVRFVPIEEMHNRLVVLLCNLKPAKMRGIVSEAMVMCASTPDKVEILTPPEGAVPGDRVIFDEFPGTPDDQLNPKKKIWEQVAPDLKTNDQRIATYKGAVFKVANKGVVKASSLANVQIK